MKKWLRYVCADMLTPNACRIIQILENNKSITVGGKEIPLSYVVTLVDNVETAQ